MGDYCSATEGVWCGDEDQLLIMSNGDHQQDRKRVWCGVLSNNCVA